ncbi:MAG: CBS domain-containing protein [Peptococcaceae bacterium]|nr:CBS domain-containing protein [Peptococcaceae bacterium]
MANKKTAEEIMVPIGDYNTISDGAAIYEAIRVLRESFHRDGRAWYGHRSVVVLNKDGEPSGILTLRGILRAAGLRELENDPDLKAESWGWYYINKLREESRLSVRDVMQPIGLAAVRAGDELTGVARALLKHSVNELPVVKKGKVVGIVRSFDVFMAMDPYFS